MTLQQSGAYPVTAGVPARPRFPARAAGAAGAAGRGLPAGRTAPQPLVRDLRERQGHGARTLVFRGGDLVVISGLPGSGKSTLIRRAAEGGGIDSQDSRDRWDGRMPRAVPYAVYRPLVRLAHYAGLRRALRSGESVIVHDCGTQSWVRRWLAREARRRGAGLHLLLLDVTPETARAGQRERGRGVSGYAFARHRRAVSRILRAVERGRLPAGCASATLLDRAAASALTRIGFAEQV
ncbi:AAA family ATPase [Streptomyces pacificus]|uniref:AAA family ATPase n=1 Tax=Streptomyces pacificus TaxID=2705029 RepID=A0A6A0AT97_9ACTN|nr:AAA family ATPase [Streptomyces pacificus]GFH35591.1 AAA family ATPase [Streptomyces pacificus]